MRHRTLTAVLTLCGTLALALSLTPIAAAHPADLSTQVIVTIDIAPDGVTHEVMIPLKQALLDVYGGIDYPAYLALDPAEADRVLADYHAEHNTVAIDGEPVGPDVAGRTETTLTTVPDAAIPAGEYLDHAFLSYAAFYPSVSEPGRVELVWGTFAFDRVGLAGGTFESLPSAERARGPMVAELNALDKSTLIVFSPDEPAYTWHGNASAAPAALLLNSAATTNTPPAAPTTTYYPVLSLAVLAIGGVFAIALVTRQQVGAAIIALPFTLAAAAVCFPFGGTRTTHPTAATPAPITRPSDALAIAAFTALHENIYSAFDYSRDSDIYDALAQSVAGPELEAIYRDVYASLILREEGGAVSKVSALEMHHAAVVAPDPEVLGPDDDPDAAFGVRCQWTVRGLVSHFGHTHERVNLFDATYTVTPRGGAWRIVGTQMHHQERLDRPGEDADADADPPDLDDLLGTDG